MTVTITLREVLEKMTKPDLIRAVENIDSVCTEAKKERDEARKKLAERE